MSFINNVLKVFVGDKAKKDVKALQPLIDKINAFEKEMEKLSHDALREKTHYFKKQLQEATANIQDEIESLKQEALNETDIDKNEEVYNKIDQLKETQYSLTEKVLEEILPEAFAVVKETAKRFTEAEEIEVTASAADRRAAAEKDYVNIQEDKAIWSTSWDAAGKKVKWDMVHYPVQLIGGIALHQGKIAEMQTGEGKTLVATLPVYLNALTGNGVHLVTVNDYLAKRDSAWMAPLFEFHGMTIDCIDHHQPNSPGRRAAYEADITYGTNNEFGFDYLRDNMAHSPSDLVQRAPNFAIVDEVDSVLVDDARTPLIISGPVPEGDRHEFTELKPRVNELVSMQRLYLTGVLSEAKKLIAAGDEKEGGFQLLRVHRGLPKNKALIKFLSEEGVKQLLQKTENFYMQDNNKQMPEVDAELWFVIEEKTNQIDLTEKGVSYLSTEGDRDFFVLPDIGSAIAEIENKGLDVEEEAAEKDQLFKDFSVKSERIHTLNQLLKAYTLFEKDVEYLVMDNKVMIVDEQTGRIMDGRRYSDGLHQAIEAKENVKIEAATQTFATVTLQNYFRMYRKLSGMTGTAVTEAGEFWEIYKLDVVEIPTNRPILRDDRDDLIYKTKREKYNAVIERVSNYTSEGRPVLIGTTSVEISELLGRMLQMRKIPHNILNAKLHKREADVVAEAGKPGQVTIATNMAGRGTDIKLSETIKAAGGLAIIGTERHDSRRVDRQLRGRSGRQGDPGSSQFYVSLEDNLMRLFGSDRVAKLMDRMGLEDGEVIQHSMMTKSIERAQKKVEENNFGVRKRLLEYDDVMNAQREVIYKRRGNALSGDRIKVDIINMVYDTLADLVEAYQASKDWDGFKLDFYRTFAFEPSMAEGEFADGKFDEVCNTLFHQAIEFYKQKSHRIAEAALPVFKQVYEDKNNKFDKILVPITDGIKTLQVTSVLQEVIETGGQSLTTDIEKGISIAIIDDEWKEHLRAMDDLRQSVQGAVYEQKDPLLIYKFESFELFKTLVARINQEIVGFLFRGGLPASDASQMRQAPAAPAKQPKLQESHPSLDAPVEAERVQGGRPQPAPRPVKTAPVVKEGKTYGRNDAVTVRNLSTGEVQNIKYKKALPLLAQGWVIED